jgi:hypothetical protein
MFTVGPLVSSPRSHIPHRTLSLPLHSPSHPKLVLFSPVLPLFFLVTLPQQPLIYAVVDLPSKDTPYRLSLNAFV